MLKQEKRPPKSDGRQQAKLSLPFRFKQVRGAKGSNC